MPLTLQNDIGPIVRKDSLELGRSVRHANDAEELKGLELSSDNWACLAGLLHEAERLRDSEREKRADLTGTIWRKGNRPVVDNLSLVFCSSKPGQEGETETEKDDA